jgi:capsular polysaccharide biosynthesis protein
MSAARSILFAAVRGFDRIVARLPACGRFQPLLGAFSAYEELLAERLPGQVLVDRQVTGVCPPGSMTEISGHRQHDHQPWPVFWTCSDDARLVGAQWQWRDRQNRFCAEGNYHLPHRRRLSEDKLFAPILLPPGRKLDGAWTSLASNWGDGRNYYHWITDNLTRLRVRDELPEKTRVLLPRHTAPYILETLGMLGITGICEAPADSCVRPERYYFCSPTALTGVWNPLGFDWLRERFRKFFAAPVGPPVFLTRRGASRVPDRLGEIERIFEGAGFEIVDCGALSVREQIARTSAATAVAGLHGAAMTNLLWLQPGTPVLELFQPGYLNGCYEQIAFQGRLDYHFHILGGAGALDAIGRWCADPRLSHSP